MFHKSATILIMAMLWVAECFAGQLTAKVEPKQVQFGNTITLEVSYEGQDSGLLQPQFGDLNRDFAIYSNSTSMQSQYINGVGQQKRVWTLTLMPQKEGKLTIPAITAGNYQTVPLNIEVLPAGSGAARSNSSAGGVGNAVPADADADSPNFWMEMSVDTKKPYIQQEVNGTLVIYDNRNIQFTSDPVFANAGDWEIKQIGEPLITNKNEQRVIKIKYALFPQKSGNLTVPEVTVNGFYIEKNKNGVTNSVNGIFRFFDINMDFTDFTGQQKPVLLKTKPIEVEVKPVPEDYGNNWWLPATEVTLQAKWVDERPVFKVGEAVTREITLSASGVTETQLPELDFPENPAWKQYPENPIFVAATQGNTLQSKAVTRVVYIPQRSGEQLLPEIKVRWYNVKTRHIEKAVIPAETMYIQKDSGAENNIVQNPPVAQNYEPQSFPEYDKAVNKAVDDLLQKIKLGAIIALAFAAGLLISYLLLRRRSGQSKDEVLVSGCVKQIEQALKVCDYRALRDNLLRWGEQAFTDAYINNLDDLAALVKDAEFTQQLQILNKNLYSGATEALDAKVIAKFIKKCQKERVNPKKPPLPDLYK